MEFNTLFEKVIDNVTEAFDMFITKRAAGAKKIEQSARKKGKYSILTAYHFAGKVKPYAQAHKWLKKDNCDELFKEEYKKALDVLKNIDNLSQKEFQKLSGVLEVWGEVYLQCKTPKDYNE